VPTTRFEKTIGVLHPQGPKSHEIILKIILMAI